MFPTCRGFLLLWSTGRKGESGEYIGPIHIKIFILQTVRRPVCVDSMVWRVYRSNTYQFQFILQTVRRPVCVDSMVYRFIALVGFQFSCMLDSCMYGMPSFCLYIFFGPCSVGTGFTKSVTCANKRTPHIHLALDFLMIKCVFFFSLLLSLHQSHCCASVSSKEMLMASAHTSRANV